MSGWPGWRPCWPEGCCWPPGWPGSVSWANFLSRTVLVGFLTGVGIQVAAGQLPAMLGVAVAGGQTLPVLLDTARALPHAHLADVAVSAEEAIVIVLAARGSPARSPGR